MTHAQDHLAQALAAFFATLIAAIAQHAAEHPLLAPSLRMSIRQIEKLAKQLDALAIEWQTTRHHPTPRKKPPHTLPPGLRPRRIDRQSRGAAPARRPAIAPWHPAYARAPPHPNSVHAAP
jgi:hypothetical protein